MVWELFQALRRLCVRITQYPADNESEIRQDAAISIILAVQCVEVFLNIYFRVLVSEAAFAHAAEQVTSDLQNPRFGLDSKLKDWPELVFGKRLNLSEGVGQRFIALKSLRIRLMHFTSTHQTIEIPGVAIHGLADVSAYQSLSAQSALDALYTSEDFLCEVFALRGITPENLPHALHSWTGKVPT
jgi:hypothetical protein